MIIGPDQIINSISPDNNSTRRNNNLTGRNNNSTGPNINWPGTAGVTDVYRTFGRLRRFRRHLPVTTGVYRAFRALREPRPACRSPPPVPPLLPPPLPPSPSRNHGHRRYRRLPPAFTGPAAAVKSDNSSATSRHCFPKGCPGWHACVLWKWLHYAWSAPYPTFAYGPPRSPPGGLRDPHPTPGVPFPPWTFQSLAHLKRLRFDRTVA